MPIKRSTSNSPLPPASPAPSPAYGLPPQAVPLSPPPPQQVRTNAEVLLSLKSWAEIVAAVHQGRVQLPYNIGRFPFVPRELEHVCVPIDSIRLDPRNPRKNDKAAQKLARLLKLNGFRKAICPDQDGILRAGNTAHKAAKLLGMTHIPALPSGYTTEVDKVNYTVSDNEASTWSEWDDEILMELRAGQLLEREASGFSDKQWRGLEFSAEMPPELQEVDVTGQHKELGDFIVVRFPGREVLSAFKARIKMAANERSIEAATFINAVQGMTELDAGVPF